MYSAWIKLDDSLPWIELEEAFQTKAEAQQAVKETLSRAKIKIAKLPKEKHVKAVITVKALKQSVARVTQENGNVST